MNPLEKRWTLAPKITPEVEKTLGEYPPILRQLLFNRGITAFEQAEI